MKQFVLSWMEKVGLSTKGFGWSFVKNTSWIGLGSFIEYALSYFIIVLVSRFLGAEGLGQYSFIFAFAGFFMLFSDFGLSQLLLKDFSKGVKHESEYLSSAFVFKLFLAFVSLLFYMISIFFIGKNYLIVPLALAGILSAITGINIIFNSLLRVRHKGFKFGLAKVIERVIALSLGFYFLFIYQSLSLFVLGLLISQIVKGVFLFLSSKEYFKDFFWSINFVLIKDLLRKSFPFLLMAVFSIIYVQLDSVMLSFMKGDFITGLYNAPYRLINVMNLVPTVLLMIGFPLFSKLYHEDRGKTLSFLKKLVLFSLGVLLPVIILVFLYGDWALNFIYGFNQIESFIVFKILIIAEIFVFLTILLGQFIAAIGRQKVFAKIGGSGALLNILLNFLLIPKFSLYGAAIATLITYLFMFFWMLILFRKI